jgi:hypothetical protein
VFFVRFPVAVPISILALPLLILALPFSKMALTPPSDGT